MAVQSAKGSLTAVFGMGTGVPSPLKRPRLNRFFKDRKNRDKKIQILHIAIRQMENDIKTSMTC